MREIVISRRRQGILLEELRFALNSTPRKDLETWGARTVQYFAAAGVRRLKGASALLRSIALATQSEVFRIADAAKSGRWTDYLDSRVTAVSAGARDAARTINAITVAFGRLAERNPAEAAIKLAAFVLGFNAGSGGVDGDGGIPDLDISAFGIEDHRSIFTHSIISGLVIETATFAFVDLVALLHRRLPTIHSRIWDTVAAQLTVAGDAWGRGISIGIAWHLAVDATVDGQGQYADLPISLPEGGHQILTGINSIVEASDAYARPAFNPGDLVAEFSTFADAKAFVAAYKTRQNLMIRRAQSGGFRIVWAPRKR